MARDSPPLYNGFEVIRKPRRQHVPGRRRRKDRIGGLLLEILYPGLCVCCGDSLLFRGGLDFPICGSCLEALEPISSSRRCLVCSTPLISERQRCTRCSRSSFSFEDNYSIYEYRGLVRRIVSQFKFSNRRSLSRFVADRLGAELEGRYRGLPIVPVPGSRRSVRRRGWDPMMEVARALNVGDLTEVLPLLTRRPGGAQKGLHYRERLENIRGRITLRRNAASVPERVVLIDDIFTSGATADECARVLKQAGAWEVHVLTLALEM
jgi:competence protein ComFC